MKETIDARHSAVKCFSGSGISFRFKGARELAATMAVLAMLAPSGKVSDLMRWTYTGGVPAHVLRG